MRRKSSSPTLPKWDEDCRGDPGGGPVEPPRPAAGKPIDFGFMAFSLAFMKQYWFHFELATVLLLAGIVAAWTAIRESQDPQDGAA